MAFSGRVTIDITAITTTSLIAAVPGSRIAIQEILLWNVAEQDLEFRDGTASLSGPLDSYPAKSGLLLPFSGAPHFELLENRPFQLVTSAIDQVSGYLNYDLLTD